MTETLDRCDNPLGGGVAMRRYTLHIDFVAPDRVAATGQAEAYAQGLSHLRGEVDCYTATISPGDNPDLATPVFCGVPGPDPTDVCVDIAGHPGTHHGPGATPIWVTNAVPRARRAAGAATRRHRRR